MIVERRRYNVKRNRGRELAAHILEEMERFGPPYAYRVYVDHAQITDEAAVELEFEHLAEQERMWSEWGGTPESRRWVERFNELVERGGTRKFWVLAE